MIPKSLPSDLIRGWSSGFRIRSCAKILFILFTKFKTKPRGISAGLFSFFILVCVIASSHPKCDFADEPLSAPVKATFPFQLSNHLFNDPSGEAHARRWLYDWPASFYPPQVQASVGLLRPFQVDVAIGRGQSAIFGCVSRQLVQADGDGLCGVRP
jgi:hypothetical protein